MTFTYDSLGLCRHWDHSVPATLIKWHNRALLKDRFLSEWQARADAIELALDVYGDALQGLPVTSSDADSAGAPLKAPLKSSCPLNRSTKSLRVGFASDLELLIGIEDSLHMYKIDVPLVALANGSMPWSCPNFDGTAGPPRTFVTATSSSFDQPTPVQSPVVPPDWVSDIWNLLCAEGVPDDDEDELVIFVNSYYIDHRTHRYHAEARPLRFDQNVQEWNRDVQLIWEDFLDHSVPFVVTLVRPLPPTLVYRGTVATVIVHQHLDLDRTACLITSVYAAAPAPHFHESAHSIERRIAPTRLVQLAGAAEVCQQRSRDGHGECTLHVGFQHVPITPDVETTHGLGFTLRIPPEMSIAELEQNLHHRLQRQSPLPGGSHANSTVPPELAHPAPNSDLPDPNSTAPEDEVSFMARSAFLYPRGRSVDMSTSSSRTSSSSSSSTSSPDWRSTVSIGLDGRALTTSLPWHDQDLLLHTLAESWNIPRDDLVLAQHVSNRPLDFIQQDLQCLLILQTCDPRPSEFSRLVLIDLESYEPNQLQPSALRRFSKWMPCTINRISVFRLLGFGHLCQDQSDQCRLHYNNAVVRPDRVAPFHLIDGDYLQLFIGAVDVEGCRTSDSSDATAISSSTFSSIAPEIADHHSLFQQDLRSFTAYCRALRNDLLPLRLKTSSEHIVSPRVDRTYDSFLSR